ncbi:hypothetical protein ACQKMI_23150 [Lysinibacillus sp. NPDC097214]|uniref:hypothetical protein n=1 Tax=Lysinibacillus sp. NPDC097214 TaxID=3390584 RepID=UPI003D0419AF
MEGQDWGLEKVIMKKESVNGLKWLPEEHFKQLEKLLNHLNLGSYLNGPINEQEAIHMKLEDNNVRVQEVKFDDRTKVEIASGEGVTFLAKLFHVDEVMNEDGTYNLHLVTIDDGEIIVDSVTPTDSKVVGLSEIINSLIPKEQDVNAQAWYDSLPCVGNGCCTFTSTALGVILYHHYNWCGANCGSGTPINAADTCCRTHDYCYGSFSSYPDRCKCDQNLINCLGNTSSPGAILMAAAFKIKMGQNC